MKMQDSRQYSINTEEASSLQLKLSTKHLHKSYAHSGIVTRAVIRQHSSPGKAFVQS